MHGILFLCTEDVRVFTVNFVALDNFAFPPLFLILSVHHISRYVIYNVDRRFHNSVFPLYLVLIYNIPEKNCNVINPTYLRIHRYVWFIYVCMYVIYVPMNIIVSNCSIVTYVSWCR